MQVTDDPGALKVLEAFGIGPASLLGSGGEAWVFALDRDRVLRVSKTAARKAAMELRVELLGELARSAHRVPFAIPEVLDLQTVAGRIATIEARIPGRVLRDVLDEAAGAARAALVRAYLDAASQIGDLVLERPDFGEVARVRGLTSDSFRGYLEAAAARSLAIAGRDFAQLDAAGLARAWPEPEAPALVHLDAFPGNMLAEGGVITGVLDFSVLCIVGDRRLEPLTATAYLADEITPVASDADRAVAHEWLAAQGLAPLYPAAERWLGAFWSGALDEPRLQAWSRRVLGIPSRS